MLFALLLACSGPKDAPEDTGPDTGEQACAGLGADAPPVTVRVVDEAGAPLAADRVRWLDGAASMGLWEDAADARCATGAPPCDTWVLDGDLPPYVLVAADRRDESVDPQDRPCIGWGAIAVWLRVDPASPQRVSLTLPTDALWCDDGATIGPEGIGRFETLDDADCRMAPESASGPLTVHVTEADGSPSAAVWVQWYWPPKSAEYDGDHDLVCVSSGCGDWVGPDAPTAGDLYVAAMAWGPPVPDYLSGALWSGYGAGPQVGASAVEVDIALEWSLSVLDGG